MRKQLAILAAPAAAALVLAGAPAAHATGSVAFVASSTSSSLQSGGKTPASITLPTWTAGTHDIIVIAVALNKSDAITTPSGWTDWTGEAGFTSGAYLDLFYKVAVSGDSATSVSFTLASGARWALIAQVYSNAVIANAAGPYGYTSGTSVTMPSISWADGTTRMFTEYVAAEPAAGDVNSSISPMSAGYGDAASAHGNHCGTTCRNVDLFTADKAGVSSSPESPSSLTDSVSAYHTTALVSFTPYS